MARSIEEIKKDIAEEEANLADAQATNDTEAEANIQAELNNLQKELDEATNPQRGHFGLWIAIIATCVVAIFSVAVLIYGYVGIAGKADATAVNQALAGKAAKTELAQLNKRLTAVEQGKADARVVATRLAGKADRTYVDQKLAGKADRTEVEKLAKELAGVDKYAKQVEDKRSKLQTSVDQNYRLAVNNAARLDRNEPQIKANRVDASVAKLAAATAISHTAAARIEIAQIRAEQSRTAALAAKADAALSGLRVTSHIFRGDEVTVPGYPGQK